jgi:tetratricopeptide (TPR) repeat protein
VVLPPDRLPARAGEARWLAASGLERAGHGANAETAYRAALGRWPGSPGAWLGLGNVALAAGRLADASPASRRAAALDPSSAPAWNKLAHTLHRLGRRSEALVAAERAVSLGGPHLQTAQRTLEEIRAGGAGRAEVGYRPSVFEELPWPPPNLSRSLR